MTNRALAIIVLIFVLLSNVVACAPEPDIEAAMFDSLKEISKAGLNAMDSELDKLAQQLFAAEEKLLNLKQVATPALSWLEYQKGLKRLSGTWEIYITDEGLVPLKNRQYQITKVVLSITNAGSSGQKLATTIRVRDMISGDTGNWEETEGQINKVIADLTQLRQDRLRKGALINSTINSIIRNQGKDWQVRSINSDTYSITGPDLGWGDKFTTGQWTYYVSRKELVPADSKSMALKTILAGTF